MARGGVKGKSGRRTFSEELLRYKVRQRAWEVTGEYIDSKASKKDRAFVAVGIVKADMAKPIVIEQNEQHTHLTMINIDTMTAEELLDLAMGRKNGFRKPQAALPNQA